MLLEKRATAAVALFEFSSTVYFKIRVKQQQISEGKTLKSVKVVGNFLPS